MYLTGKAVTAQCLVKHCRKHAAIGTYRQQDLYKQILQTSILLHQVCGGEIHTAPLGSLQIKQYNQQQAPTALFTC